MKKIYGWLKPSYQSNPSKFFIYRILYNFMVFMPVWVIYVQDRYDLSLTQITLIDTAFWLTMAVTEIPTGAVADTVGRKASQFIGTILAAGALLLFALAPSYPILLIANSLWAFALTFVSGAELAFLYDSMQVLDRKDEYPKYRGILSAAVMSAIALSSLLGGVIGQISLLTTFLVSAGCLTAGALITLLFKEPPRDTENESNNALTYKETLSISFDAIKKEKELRYALLYISFLPVMGATIRITFIQPHALKIGLPISVLGLLAFGIRGFQILGASSVKFIMDTFDEWKWLILAGLITFGGLLALGAFNSLWGIAFFALSGFARSATSPLAEKMVLRHTPAPCRATILSIASFLYRLLLAAVEPGIGLIGDHWGLPTAFLVMAVVFGISMLLILIGWNRVRQPQVQPG